MIPQSSLAMWTAIAPALANHIWQSTLFALMAGLLTLILQKNHARTRYWLWLAASAKFLVPFSLLFRIGSYLSWSRRFAGTKPGLYFAMEKVSQAFTQPCGNPRLCARDAKWKHCGGWSVWEGYRSESSW